MARLPRFRAMLALAAALSVGLPILLVANVAQPWADGRQAGDDASSTAAAPSAAELERQQRSAQLTPRHDGAASKRGLARMPAMLTTLQWVESAAARSPRSLSAESRPQSIRRDTLRVRGPPSLRLA